MFLLSFLDIGRFERLNTCTWGPWSPRLYAKCCEYLRENLFKTCEEKGKDTSTARLLPLFVSLCPYGFWHLVVSWMIWDALKRVTRASLSQTCFLEFDLDDLGTPWLQTIYQVLESGTVFTFSLRSCRPRVLLSASTTKHAVIWAATKCCINDY